MVSFDWTAIKKIGDSFMVRVPARVFKDPAFPFKEDESLIVEIRDKTIVIRKES